MRPISPSSRGPGSTGSASVRCRGNHDPGRPAVSALGEHLAGWWPEPLTGTDILASWSVGAFAALLDQPAPGPGDPLPPMWHWFSFLDHPGQAELGADGHPGAG